MHDSDCSGLSSMGDRIRFDLNTASGDVLRILLGAALIATTMMSTVMRVMRMFLTILALSAVRQMQVLAWTLSNPATWRAGLRTMHSIAPTMQSFSTGCPKLFKTGVCDIEAWKFEQVLEVVVISSCLRRVVGDGKALRAGYDVTARFGEGLDITATNIFGRMPA